MGYTVLNYPNGRPYTEYYLIEFECCLVDGGTIGVKFSGGWLTRVSSKREITPEQLLKKLSVAITIVLT